MRRRRRRKKNNDCTLTFYVDIFGDGVFDSLRGDLYFGRNGFHFSDLKPDDQICCNFTANSSVYYIVSPLLFRGVLERSMGFLCNSQQRLRFILFENI